MIHHYCHNDTGREILDGIGILHNDISNVGEFDDVLDSSSSKNLSEPLEKICLTYCSVKSFPTSKCNGALSPEKSQKLLDIEDLTLKTPTSKATLVRDLSLVINEKEHLLVSASFSHLGFTR